MPSPNFAQFRQQLAERLNDPSMVFWTDAELRLHVYDALRFWNTLTGDARQWWSLAVPGDSTTVWYDLFALPSSPRLATQTDQDIYSRMQYALLEQQAAAAQCMTGQYQPQALIDAVEGKRDEFLFATACTTTVRPLNLLPNATTVTLPASVIAVRRGYWLPTSEDGTAYPMFMGDEWELASYQPSDVGSPGVPTVYCAGTVPPYVVTIAPPAAQPGKVEFLTYDSQATLNPRAGRTPLLMPSDFMPALVWGALADVLNTTAEGHDAARAKYCEERFAQFIELYALYPSVLAARLEGVPYYVDAVEVLDTYDPTWRTITANPQSLGLSGGNLVAFPSATAMSLPLLVVSNAPLPVNDSDPMPLGNEVLDVVLDYAQHTASFKMGGSEFLETMPLLEGIVSLAAKRNAKIRALSTFRDILMTRAEREDILTPKEKADATQSG